MRIAISGTHCSGKSTLVEAFLQQHPDYSHEPEPYTALVEDHGEEFSAAPTAEEFLRQLEFNIDRLGQYKPGDNVIFERCPADFLAYLLALRELNREGGRSNVLETARALAERTLGRLELIGYLPADEIDVEVPEEEDPALRSAMDRQLASILLDDQMVLFASHGTQILELTGSITDRLRLLEKALLYKSQ